MKYLYEFIGTFFLVFTVGMAVMGPNSAGNLAPVAIGSVLAVLVYAGGSVSGGHYNPAVSLAVFLRKKLSIKDLGVYWIVQFLGGALAALTALYFKGTPEIQALEFDSTKVFLAEFLFTFLLCFVVLNAATLKLNQNNSYFGFAIGFTVLVGAFAVGTISGAAFNPAVAFGAANMNLSEWSNLWVFIVAAFLGSFVSAFLVNQVESPEKGH